MLVLVGIFMQMNQDGLCAPVSIFFFFIAGTFVLAAILHPQEFFCIVHGFIYFLAIPSMYMLLLIYSYINLHVVSWGTREVKQTQTDKQKEEERLFLEEQKKKAKTGVMSSLMTKMNISKSSDNDEGFTLRLADLFKCVCCLRQPLPPDNSKLDLVLTKLEMMEAKFKTQGAVDAASVKGGDEGLLAPSISGSVQRSVSFKGNKTFM